MADLNALLDVIPVGDIAKQLGIDENVAELAVKQVLPGLVGGLAANAHDDRGQEVLGNVLKHHNTGVARSVDEVDLIVERHDGNIVGIEVKLAASIDDRDVRHLHWLAEHHGPRVKDLTILTTGPHAYRRPDGIAVVPLGLLGP